MIVKIDGKLIEEIFYILTEATLSSRDHYNENEFCLLLESNSLESLNKIINSDNFITYGYYHSEKLVGFVILDMNTNWLSKIFVSPDYQSMGIGKKLLNFSLDLFKNHGLSFLYLIARNNSIWFYKKYGFVDIGEYIKIINGSKISMRKMEIKL